MGAIDKRIHAALIQFADDLVNRKLENLAKGLAEFGKPDEAQKAAGKKRTTKKKPEDKE